MLPPVEKCIIPLMPAPPESTDLITTEPDDVAVPAPVNNEIEPPVPPVPAPPVLIKCPPWPAVPLDPAPPVTSTIPATVVAAVTSPAVIVISLPSSVLPDPTVTCMLPPFPFVADPD